MENYPNFRMNIWFNILSQIFAKLFASSLNEWSDKQYDTLWLFFCCKWPMSIKKRVTTLNQMAYAGHQREKIVKHNLLISYFNSTRTPAKVAL